MIRLGPVEIDQAARRVVVDGTETMLTSREWAVLEQFLRRPGVTIGKSQIEDALYAFGAEIESNTVEVYVSRCARRSGARPSTTVRGLGYRLASP